MEEVSFRLRLMESMVLYKTGAQCGKALVNIVPRFQKCRLTMRAPDWWESARFQAGFWLEVGSGKAALSRPAHQRVTPTVSLLIAVRNH